MLKKRLIFTLLVDNDNFMLSRNFSLQTVGNLEWIDKHYGFENLPFYVDEIILLNVNRDYKNISNFAKMLNKISKRCFIPISAGGGIRNIEDAYVLFNSGADKIVLNTALFQNEDLVKDIVLNFGSQSIVASIDYKIINNKRKVFLNNGQSIINLDVEDAVELANKVGVGEIYLSSMDRDGTGQGYDLELLKDINKTTRVPIIASGGAGTFEHFVDVIKCCDIDAVSTANLFNYMGDGLLEARNYIMENDIELAKWSIDNFDF